MAYSLSQKSIDKMKGVDPKLVKVVLRAIEITEVDFGVVCGLRTVAEQKALVAKGASQTMKSKHIEGKAVDLMAYIDGRASWELNLYDNIADAMRKAAIEQGVKIRWGGAWQVGDIREWKGTMQSAMDQYVDQRRKAGKSAFIDGPHFELN